MIKQTKEEITLEQFTRFWNIAREWKDEDGDNFLTWDKSVIGQFCFSTGKSEQKKEEIEFLRKLGGSFIIKTKEGCIDIISERISKLEGETK